MLKRELKNIEKVSRENFTVFEGRMYVQRQQLLNNLNWERNLWQYGMHWRGGGGTGGSKYIIGTQLK